MSAELKGSHKLTSYMVVPEDSAMRQKPLRRKREREGVEADVT